MLKRSGFISLALAVLMTLFAFLSGCNLLSNLGSSSSSSSSGGTSSSSVSSVSSSSSSSSGSQVAAIGWIGGGQNSWQTNNAPNWGTVYQSFTSPYDICVDSSGYIYVADCGNSRIDKWNSSGVAIGMIGFGTNGWQTIAGSIPEMCYDGFDEPQGVYVDSSGNIYVADQRNNRIDKWSSLGIAQGWIGMNTNGWYTNTGVWGGIGYQSFLSPCGVCVDSSGYIYVADTTNSRICKWSSGGAAIGWIGGGSSGWQTGSALGYSSDYQSFYNPFGVFLDSSGYIYVADSANNRICKWNSAGVAQGWIGGGTNGWQTVNAPAAGSNYQSFNSPCGVCVDGSGYIYVADSSNNRVCKWNSAGVAQGWIGGSTNGWQTGIAPAAGSNYQSFNYPTGVYVDSSENIYVADYYNNRICKWH
jgi:sugar lactone lactonase YvrE